ncbi:hypothetical protein F5050DRAFT_1742608 [Lentinula boryana]|uniref:Uncharacterized protein n=1 Tax=Lentinula boryana TaxID=40481 RepID=A0ABQ8QJU9_9AGAR|nr:hypothetical protein F5050DRAFT_1742608 [Lentinula boryana]
MAASRSPGLAIAAATAISISAGAMFVMQKDVKRKEGQASIFRACLPYSCLTEKIFIVLHIAFAEPGDSGRTVGKAGDEHISSAELSEVVSQRASRGNPTNGERK